MRKINIKVSRTNTLTGLDINNLKKDKDTINLSTPYDPKYNPFTTKKIVPRNSFTNVVPRIVKNTAITCFLLALSIFVVSDYPSNEIAHAEEEIDMVQVEQDIQEIIEEIQEEIKKEEVEVLPTQYQEKNSYVDKAMEVLTSLEGFSTVGYCDNLIYTKDGRYVRHCPTGNERYSIGYGTLSYPNETITYNEGVARMREVLLAKAEDLKDLSCYNDNEKAGILDFIYNSGKYTKHNRTGVYFIHYVRECNKEVIEGFLNPAHYQSKGLKKRRLAQYNLFMQGK